jgi:hypothetical protein
MRASFLKSIALATILSLVGAESALAYIDPNTGGLLFQLLAVIFASISAMFLIFSRQIRVFFTRVRRFVRDRFGSQDSSAEKAAAGADPSAAAPDQED